MTKKITHEKLVEILLETENAGGLKNTFFSYKINTDARENDLNKFSRGDMTAEQREKKILANLKAYEKGKISADEFSKNAEFLENAVLKIPLPFSDVRKISVGCARLGVNYKKAVENKAERISGNAVTFEPEKMKGKHHFQNSSIIAASDKEPEKLYLIFDARAARAAKSKYIADGKEIPKAVLGEYMKPKPPGFIPWRTVTVSNIKEAKINGVKYVLE